MSVGYYIVLDQKEPGFETFVNGKAVASAADALDALCDNAKIYGLDSFIGQSMQEFAELLGEDIELPEGADGGAKWFSADEGIRAIDALIRVVRKNTEAVASAGDVIEDLYEYQEVLSRVKAIGAKWHLALDI